MNKKKKPDRHEKQLLIDQAEGRRLIDQIEKDGEIPPNLTKDQVRQIYAAYNTPTDQERQLHSIIRKYCDIFRKGLPFSLEKDDDGNYKDKKARVIQEYDNKYTNLSINSREELDSISKKAEAFLKRRIAPLWNVKMCERGGCTNELPPKRSKYCCDDCYKKDKPAIYLNSMKDARERHVRRKAGQDEKIIANKIPYKLSESKRHKPKSNTGEQ